MKHPLFFFLLFFCAGLTACKPSPSGPASEIEQQTEDYVKTFNHHDAAALANLWSEDALYIDPRTGTQIQGREAIKEVFQSQFEEHPDTHLAIKHSSIDFPSPQKAIVKGTATLTIPGEFPIETRYVSTYEKKENHWQLTRVSEIDAETSPSQYEKLQPLEWLIGTWVDKDEDTTVETIGSWNKSKNFIKQRFTVSTLGSKEIDGKQIIGWDPLEQRIRSWVFDSDGGFGEGKWSKQGDNWVAEMIYTTPEGQRATAIHIFSNIQPNSYTWTSTGRQIDEEILPNMGPITVKKQPSTGS